MSKLDRSEQFWRRISVCFLGIWVIFVVILGIWYAFDAMNEAEITLICAENQRKIVSILKETWL